MHPIVIEEGKDKQLVSIDGYQMAYFTAGNPGKPAVVLIHGWLSHTGIWRETMAHLQDDFYCIAVDLLGNGHSDKPSDADYSIHATGQRVIAVLDSLGIDQFICVGHSMGVMIGLYLASSLAQERIDKLVVVDGIATGSVSLYVRLVHMPNIWLGSLLPKLWGLSRIGVRYGWYRQLMNDNILYYQRGLSHYDDAAVQMALLKGMEIPAYKQGHAIISTDLTPQLNNITAPTLVVFGKHDNTVPIKEGYTQAEHIPNCTMIVYEKCSHVPMVEAQSQFLADLKQFLLSE